ncbi:iron transporter [Vibrio cholerae]|nr:iron transporter [Vibrio cholerae]HDZ9470840.1 iron transporter [Vibrio cholerae]HEJ2462830.1 iron transporter [Vibrio cholerae]
MVSVVVIEFSGMRCQPLRRALADFYHLVCSQVYTWPSFT